MATKYYLFSLFLIAIVAVITRPFTVLFHELGHAIPALILTRKPVTIYLGSYGDPTNSKNLRIGPLNIWFRYNPLAWWLGLCVPSATNISIAKQYIYILGGPLNSLLIAIVACYIAFVYEASGLVEFVAVIFLSSSVLDFYYNLVPNDRPIRLYNGNVTYNDGYSLKRLYYFNRYATEFKKGNELYNDKKYAEAAVQYEYLIAHFRDVSLYRCTIYSHILQKNYPRARELFEQLQHFYSFNADDYTNAGYTYYELNLFDDALNCYNKSLSLNPQHPTALNNRIYLYNRLERYEEAITLCNQAIAIDSTSANHFNNRGLAKVKTGQSEEGLQDIQHSLSMNPNNSYAFRNLGIYHLENKDYEAALIQFSKANELDPNTHLLRELIEQTEGNLTI